MRYLGLAVMTACALGMPACAQAWDLITTGRGPQQIVDGGPGAQSVSHATGGTAYGGTAYGSTAYGGAGGAGGAGGRGGSAAVNVYNNANSGNGGGTASSPAAVNNVWDSRNPVAGAVAPAITNYNACSGSSTSAAAQFAPFGLSFGTGGGFDNACRLHMLHQDRAAVAYLCRVNGDIRQAFRDIGEPCPQDMPPAQPQEQVTAYPYDYCFTRNTGDRDQHRECDRPIQVTTTAAVRR